MYLQFGHDIAAVRDDRMGRNAERVGDLLVAHALDDADDDFALADAQRLLTLLAGRLIGQLYDFAAHAVL